MAIHLGRLKGLGAKDMMDIALASIATVIKESIYGPYTAGMQKSHA